MNRFRPASSRSAPPRLARRPRLLGLVLAAIAGFAPPLAAHAADAPAAAGLDGGYQSVKDARWVGLPNGAQIASLYPAAAAKTHTSGFALVHCRVQSTGDLSACEPTVESPAGYGFAEATVSMARYFKLAPGRYAPDASLDIPFQWRLQ
jgi:hypothetical protein